MGVAIRVRNLSQAFKGAIPLHNISLEIEENKIYGLLGKCGEGKTTLLNIIAKKLKNESKEVEIFNENYNDDNLKEICMVGEKEFSLKNNKVIDIFKMHQIFYEKYDVKLQQELIKIFKLDNSKRYIKCSRGEKTLISNIIGICSKSKIIIFDEPTIGLDVVARELFYKILLDEYIKEPRTIIISTHLIDEIENIIEKVIILNDGKVILQGDVDSIKENAYYISLDKREEKDLFILKNKKPIREFGSMQIYFYYGIIPECDLKNLKELDANISNCSLKELFIELTKVKGV